MHLELGTSSDHGAAAFAAGDFPQSGPRRPSASIGVGPSGHAARPQVPHKLDDLSDVDLLNLILVRAQRDANALGCAQRLLDLFGDFSRVIAARPERLRLVGGLSDAQIFELKLFGLSARRLARAKLLDRPVISGSHILLDYCHTTLAHLDREQFRVLFLDRKNGLIADEVLGEGTVDHVPVYPREVMRRALDLHACALILVHNHPSGDPAPSEADITMTQSIKLVADALSITLHDHVIIGKSSEFSFASAGLL